MKKQMKLAGVLAAMAVSFGANAATIDLFSTSQAVLSDGTNGVASNYANGLSSQAGAVGDPTIIGGFRDLWVNAVSGADPAGAFSTLGVFGGQLRFSNSAGVTGVGEVQWDGNDVGPGINFTGLGGIDLTFGGTSNAFLLETIESDLGYTFEATIYTDANRWTRISLDATEVSGLGPAVLSTIPFGAFIDPLLCGTYGAAPGVNGITCGAGGVADILDVGALVVRINTGDPLAPGGAVPATTNIDLRIGSITTVPEPGMLGLLGVAMAGMGLALRRRRQV